MDRAGWYQIAIERGVMRVILHGEFDIVESQELLEALGPLVSNRGARVRVDMSDVSYFGSIALRALLASGMLAREAGSTFNVVDPSSFCRMLFDATGVSELLGVEASMSSVD
jgi:anti-anti-sigma factor